MTPEEIKAKMEGAGFKPKPTPPPAIDPDRTAVIKAKMEAAGFKPVAQFDTVPAPSDVSATKPPPVAIVPQVEARATHPTGLAQPATPKPPTAEAFKPEVQFLEYPLARVFSDLVEKPGKNLSGLMARGFAAAVDLIPSTASPETKARVVKAAKDLADYWESPETGIVTPRAEQLRGEYAAAAKEAGGAIPLLYNTLDAGVGVAAFLTQAALLGKADPREAATMLGKMGNDLSRVALFRFATSEGDVGERLKGATATVAYMATPYIVAALPVAGPVLPKAIDTALNTALSSPQYVDAIKRGGLSMQTATEVVPMLLTDILFSLRTRGSPDAEYKLAVEKHLSKSAKLGGLPKEQRKAIIDQFRADTKNATLEPKSDEAIRPDVEVRPDAEKPTEQPITPVVERPAAEGVKIPAEPESPATGRIDAADAILKPVDDIDRPRVELGENVTPEEAARASVEASARADRRATAPSALTPRSVWEVRDADGVWRKAEFRGKAGRRLAFSDELGRTITIKPDDLAERVAAPPTEGADISAPKPFTAQTIQDLGLPEPQLKKLVRQTSAVQSEFLKQANPSDPAQFDANLQASRAEAAESQIRWAIEAKRDAAIESGAITEKDYGDVVRSFGLTPELRTEAGKLITPKQAVKLRAAIEGLQDTRVVELRKALSEAKGLRPEFQEKADGIRRAVNVDGTSDKVLEKVKGLVDYMVREYGADPENLAGSAANNIHVFVPYSLLKMADVKLAREKAIPIRALDAETIGKIADIVKMTTHLSNLANGLIVKGKLERTDNVVRAGRGIADERQARYAKLPHAPVGSKGEAVNRAATTAIERITQATGKSGLKPRTGPLRYLTAGALRSVMGLVRRLTGKDSDWHQILVDDFEDGAREQNELYFRRVDAMQAKLGELGITPTDLYDIMGRPDYKTGEPGNLIRFKLTDPLSREYASPADTKGVQIKAAELTPGEAIDIYLAMRDPSTRSELIRKTHTGMALKRKDISPSAGSFKLGRGDLLTVARFVAENPKLKGIADFLSDYKNKELFPMFNETYAQNTGHLLRSDPNVPHWNRSRVDDYERGSTGLMSDWLKWHLDDLGILQPRQSNDRPIVIEDALERWLRVTGQMEMYVAKSGRVDNATRLVNHPDFANTVKGTSWNVGPLAFRGLDNYDNMAEYLKDYQKDPSVYIGDKVSPRVMQSIYGLHPAFLGFKLSTLGNMPLSVFYATLEVPRQVWTDRKYSLAANTSRIPEIHAKMMQSPIFRGLFEGGVEKLLSAVGTRTDIESMMFGGTQQKGFGGFAKRTGRASMKLLGKANRPAIYQIYLWAEGMADKGFAAAKGQDKAIAQIAEKLFMRTQSYAEAPSMNIAQRAAKRGNPFLAIATMYQNEPSKAFELALGAIEEYQIDRTPANRAKVIQAILVTQVWPAVARELLREAQEYVYSGGKPRRPSTVWDIMARSVGATFGQIPMWGDVARYSVEQVGSVMGQAGSGREPDLGKLPALAAVVNAGKAITKTGKAALELLADDRYGEDSEFAGDPKWVDDLVEGFTRGLEASAIPLKLPVGGIAQFIRAQYFGLRKRVAEARLRRLAEERGISLDAAKQEQEERKRQMLEEYRRQVPPVKRFALRALGKGP